MFCQKFKYFFTGVMKKGTNNKTITGQTDIYVVMKYFKAAIALETASRVLEGNQIFLKNQ